MGLPSISQYADSIDHPHGLFRTLGEFTPVRDMYGQVQIVAGNSAAIFRISTPELPAAALKCYIKPSPYLREIYGYLGTHPDPLLVPARLLPEEIFVYDLFGVAWIIDFTWFAACG